MSVVTVNSKKMLSTLSSFINHPATMATMLDLALNSDPTTRECAVNLLKLGHNGVTQKCVDAFSRETLHHDPERRAKGYANLGFLGLSKTWDTVLRGIYDRDERVRKDVVMALGRIGFSRHHLDVMTKIVETEESREVCLVAKDCCNWIKQAMEKQKGGNGKPVIESSQILQKESRADTYIPLGF